jgi:hypothetical protein
MFNNDMAEEINQDQIESSELSFPQIVFARGDVTKMPTKPNSPDPGMGWRGGFYIPKEVADKFGGVDWTGWEEDGFVPQTGENKGKVIPVMWKQKITFVQINRRRQWVTVEDAGGPPSVGFPWSQNSAAKAASSKGRCNGHMQAVMLVKGLEAAGPLVLGAYGHTQMAWFGENDKYRKVGVLSHTQSTLLAAANAYTKALTDYNNAKTGNKTKPNLWDVYAFWLTAEASQENGKPMFYAAGEGDNTKSVIVPVAADLPPVGFHDEAMTIIRKDLSILDNPTANPVVAKMLETLGRYQVGGDVWSTVKSVRSELESRGWKAAWDTASPSPTAASSPSPIPILNGHTVAQSVKELL